ncbi:unnamed protein product [Adineta ricciae]|uniref:ETS domain-containing protein n=1 Tax=Adineta ricciae TaxID=249248 RepID=A0A814BX91_ADIRI|nr:unnamed protein product [Adineta ricciae]CAF0933200.1 unnamed protein product [Adineta ricciae]
MENYSDDTMELFPYDTITEYEFADMVSDPDSKSAVDDIHNWLYRASLEVCEIPTNRKEWLISDASSSRLRSPRLFEFLLLLVAKPHYESYASFTDRSKGIFQIHQPEKVAALWQAVKSRQSNQKMTYDKFARAIRWYYKSNIMQKTNTRYTFQFSSETLRKSPVDENNNGTERFSI